MKKRILALFLACLMAVSLLVACGSAEVQQTTGATETTKAAEAQPAETASQKPKALDADNVNPKGQFPIVKNPIKLNIALPQDPKILDYDTNKFTLFLEERTGIDLTFYYLPNQRDQFTQKVNMMLASNDLPDVFLGLNVVFQNSKLQLCAKQGSIIPLNDLIEEYGVEIYNLWENAMNRDVKKIMTLDDGKIYAMPKYSEYLNGIYPFRMWVYGPWLEKLGLSVPTTTEEFYEVLKAIKEGDPNGNGKADEIALVGAPNNGTNTDPTVFLMNAFIYNDGKADRQFVVNNGKIEAAYMKPEWKDGLAYMNRLCSEGLLDPVTFTHTTDQLKALLNQPEVIVGCFPVLGKGSQMNATSERAKAYDAIPPLIGPKGVQYATINPVQPTNNYVITTACKNPAAAFRLADFMLSEEATIYGRYGEEGVEWVKPEPGKLGNNGQPASLKVVNNVFGSNQHNTHWQFANPGYMPSRIMDAVEWNGDPKDNEYYLYKVADTMYRGKEPKEYINFLSFTEDEAEEITKLGQTIQSYLKEMTARFIIGDRSLDTWDQYLDELNKMGVQRYIELHQKAYDRIKASN